MDYEVFLAEYEVAAAALKVQLDTQMKLLKKINKYMESGDYKSAVKELAAVSDAAAGGAEAVSRVSEHITGTDMKGYLESGEFSHQLVEMCRANGTDIVAEGNNFEVFPYRLRLYPEDIELQINGKKAPGLRPKYIADTLAKGRAKLLAGSFNPAQYAAELAVAYDIAILHTAKGKPVSMDADLHLSTLYKYLTPMRRFRRDYDAQNFAFDIARLYDAQDTSLPDGRFYQFGPSRENNRAVRIVDASGIERFLATIRFYYK